MTKWIFSLVALLVVGVVGFQLFGLRYNVSESYPAGLYRVDKSRFPVVGELALFCPPDNAITQMALQRHYLKDGFCESGTVPLTKRLVAVPGDQVDLGPEGIRINRGPLIKNTKHLIADSNGGELPSYESGKIPPDSYFMISEYNPKSWDSRYFGPVGGSYIIGTVKPFFIWGESDI